MSDAAHRFGRLDVLVNNAGYGHIEPFGCTSAEDFRVQIETNLFGVVNLTRAAIPVMRAQGGGRIFQVSSAGGRIGTPGLSAYQAAKMGHEARETMPRWKPVTLAADFGAASPEWPSE